MERDGELEETVTRLYPSDQSGAFCTMYSFVGDEGFPKTGYISICENKLGGASFKQLY